LRIYSSVTQSTVDAVVKGFEAANPNVTVEVFRAPTGEVNARVATEQRDGGVQADVFWMTDPLSMQQYERDGLLLAWTPANASVVPGEFRTKAFVGTRILNLVMVAGSSLANPPKDWKDLTSVHGTVAIPDPGFAGSAFAALAFFATRPEYGMGFYRDLKANGAVQVKSPGNVVTGVADGTYAAGITLDRVARAAVEKGSPISLIWPSSGAIALYSPIGVVPTGHTEVARLFVDYVLGKEAQTAIANTGWQPVRDDVAWSVGGPQQSIDWSKAFNSQAQLLAEYRTIFTP